MVKIDVHIETFYSLSLLHQMQKTRKLPRKNSFTCETLYIPCLCFVKDNGCKIYLAFRFLRNDTTCRSCYHWCLLLSYNRMYLIYRLNSFWDREMLTIQKKNRVSLLLVSVRISSNYIIFGGTSKCRNCCNKYCM